MNDPPHAQHVRQRAHVSRALNFARAKEKRENREFSRRERIAYVVPVARPAAVHAVLAALVTIDHLPLVIDRLVGGLGLHAQRLGDLSPSLLVDDGELVPPVVVEERHHRLSHLRTSDEEVDSMINVDH